MPTRQSLWVATIGIAAALAGGCSDGDATTSDNAGGVAGGGGGAGTGGQTATPAGNGGAAGVGGATGGAGGSTAGPDASTTGKDDTGFFMWDESTSAGAIEAAIAAGIRSFRSRDLTIVTGQPAWQVFVKHADVVDLLASIPLNKAWTTTPVDLNQLAGVVNANRFVRRLQVYPELQPGLMNPTELNPCKDWATGAAAKLAQRLSDLDALVTDKSVELIVAGQMGGGDCDGLTQVFARLYDLQAQGRAVGWGVTVYPYYYGQDTSAAALSGDIDAAITGLSGHAPSGRAALPLRVLETGWPSACSARATPQNQCAFVETAMHSTTSKGAGAKLYVFELQDFTNGWTECEKHFGLFDAADQNKCASCAGCVNPLL
jgi:hypothetical protein